MSKPLDIADELNEIFNYVKQEFHDLGLKPFQYANACLFEFFLLASINNVNKDELFEIFKEQYEIFNESL